MFKKAIAGGIGLFVALIIGVAVFGVDAKWFVGDVSGQKVNDAVNQFAKWTPENIAKNPQTYLNFCEAETNKALDKMKANEISIQQKKALVEADLKKYTDKVAVGSKALGELKTKYREATAEGGSGFPIKWMSKELADEQAKKQILQLAGQVQSAEKLKTMYGSAVAQLSKARGDLQLKRDQANEQLAKIKVSMETLKIQDITKDLADQLAGMTGALGGLVTEALNEDPNQLFNLDDIEKQSETVVDEAKFDEIMGK